MGQTLEEIALELRNSGKKVQLIYAFNGTGKTRLSRTFKSLVASETEDEDKDQSRDKILYYNAFTEDLFLWNNDHENGSDPKLEVQRGSFINWIVSDQGLELRIAEIFRALNHGKLEPTFHHSFVSPVSISQPRDMERELYVTFSIPRGDDSGAESIKISRGEESTFIWCVFYALIEAVVGARNTDPGDDGEPTPYDQLEYIFIDDPVSSLDANNLAELAVNLAALVNSAPSDVRFIITTHSELFYHHLYTELNSPRPAMLKTNEDGSFELDDTKHGASNTSFFQHLHLKDKIERAIRLDEVEREHFGLLRRLYEKTAAFLGYRNWKDLLPQDEREAYHKRILNFSNHDILVSLEFAEPSLPEKRMVKFLLNHLVHTYKYWSPREMS